MTRRGAIANSAQAQPNLAGGQVGDVGGSHHVERALVELAPDPVADGVRHLHRQCGDRPAMGAGSSRESHPGA